MRIKSLKFKPAQQLVEFLLVAPIIVIIIGLLTEYAYALNTYMTLQEGLKTVTSQIYSKIKPNTSISDIRDIVKTDLTKYLAENNAPTSAENVIDVGYAIEGNSAIFIASYKYIPAFTLPNVYFKLIPDEFNFFANSVVPKAFLSENKYNGSVDSEDLDGIWAGSASFASLDAFNASKKGVMTTNVGSLPSGDKDETNMLFLIPTAVANTYALVDFAGNVKAETLDTSTGKLSSGTKFLSYATTNKYFQIVFVHDAEATPDILTDMSDYWITGSGAIADTSADGILKRTLALIDTDNDSVGNFDKVGTVAYKVENFGSMVFLTMGDNISNIIAGEAENDYKYTYTKNFGSMAP